MPGREFESIYSEYAKMVYWTAYGVMRSESDAADVSQNVFLRVISNAKKLESMNDPQLKGWLYRVTMNLCMDIKRKQKRETLTDEFSGGYLEGESADEATLPEPSAIDAERKRLIMEAITSLPEIYRETVLLHYFSGLGYESIASLSGVSEGTVKSRMSRAKQKLASLLRGGEIYGG